MKLRGLLFLVGLAVASSTSHAQLNTALGFNGTTDYVSLSTGTVSNLVNGYTIEAWEYVTTSTGVHRVLSNQLSAPSRGIGFGITGSQYRFTTYGIKDYNTAVGSVPQATWIHIAVVFDTDNTAIFYKNGALLTSITNAAGGIQSTETLNIGRNPTGTEYWQGAIDEVRIWNFQRSASQIAADYNKSLTGSETGLILYLPFSEISGSTTADLSSFAAVGTLNGCTWVPGPVLNSEARDWSIYP